MKILAIGDPHGDLEKVKQIPKKDLDLILLTGDIGKANLARARAFENKKREQKGLSKIKETADHASAVHNEIHNSTLEILKYLSKFAVDP